MKTQSLMMPTNGKRAAAIPEKNIRGIYPILAF